MAATTGGKVWDGPTRLFHWLLVGLFAFSWWSAAHDQMDRHALSGIALLGLLIFRLIWGIIGGSTARFSQFVKGPRGVLAYLRGNQADAAAGHSPLGAASVVALLILLFALVVAGLFAGDVDGENSGPLSYLVSFEHSRVAAHWHALSFTLLQALIALHIVAVLFYRLRGRDLLRPMVTGYDRHLPGGHAVLRTASPLRLMAALAIAAGLAWWVWKGLPL